jgi:hypothetical protein
VRTIGDQAVAFWPQTSDAVRELVRRAEEELYGAPNFNGGDPVEVRQLWRRIRSGMKGRELRVDSG